MTGHDIRFGRLLPEAENAVIVAMDHGEFFGPTQGLIELPKVIQSVRAADAILLSPGMVAHCKEAFAQRGAPLVILRLNWSSVYCFQWDYSEGHTVAVITPEEALALGADVGLASLILTTTDESRDAANVENFARIAAEARAAGLPLIGEYFPPDAEKVEREALHDKVYAAARILAEVGADAIKTFYTGERFAEVTQACPAPIFALGAQKLPREVDALRLAHAAVQAGARGVVFGRNVIQARDPTKFLGALKRVVAREATPQEAAATARLL
ncbi:MAG: class I fructose-bisphosphate aldolase [Armatimonadota bacterium]